MASEDAQTKSTSYLLPVEDTQFLLRDEMRATRFALEYAKAELSLRDWGIRSTIIVFGGSRIPSPEQAELAANAARSMAETDGVRDTGLRTTPCWPSDTRLPATLAVYLSQRRVDVHQGQMRRAGAILK